MKEVKYGVLIAFLVQLVLWVFSTIIFELDGFDFSSILYNLDALVILILPIEYIFFSKKFIKKKKLKSKKFDIVFLCSWFIFTILFLILADTLVRWGIILKCGGGWSCFLHGIEFYVLAFFMLLEIGVVLCVRLGQFIYKKLKKLVKN